MTAAEAAPARTAISGGSEMGRVADAVSRHMVRNLGGPPDKLYEAARHLIVHGGKRLRPYMVIKSCQMLGGSRHDARHAASAVEMVHNFTLVHDDIMDRDEMRHGVPTVHQKFGVPTAILAGDTLFSKAYQTLASAGPDRQEQVRELVSRLASTCVSVCEGQMLDMEMAGTDAIPTESEYIAMIKKKTAALFDVSCAMGAICAGGERSDVANLSGFGRNLGIAFQITDDLIGAMGDPGTTKKPVGNDIREGKKTLPILMALEESKDDRHHHEAISAAFGNPGISRSELDEAVRSVRALGIEDRVRSMAWRYADRASRRLASYSGKAKDDLENLLGFVVRRSV